MISSEKLDLLSFRGKNRILHLSWFALFLTFMVWFNHAPLIGAIQADMGLSTQQVKALLILNVAFAIPARVIVGMLVDRLGARLTYFMLLVASSFLCLLFALATTFESLALWRFLLGFVGAGFVIGIRMIGEWFPVNEMGFAQGIYAGWGNFGSAAAAITLPMLALFFGGVDGWRYAVGVTGGIMLLYAFVYYFSVTDAPHGAVLFKPAMTGAIEVTSKADLVWYLVLNIPLYVILAVLARKLASLELINSGVVSLVDLVLVSAYLFQTHCIYQVNAKLFRKPLIKTECYRFKQVVILSIAYFVTFGAQIAVVSMLPLFFKATFDMSLIHAGLVASCFALMCLVARPLGGLLSDRYGRKRTLGLLLGGAAIGFLLMSLIDKDWPLVLAIVVTVICATFVLGGTGAVFAIVPLVQRHRTGQIAGMTSAYGVAGGVFFLTVFFYASLPVFFLVIALATLTALAAVFFLDEPQGEVGKTAPGCQVDVVLTNGRMQTDNTRPVF